MTDDKIIHMAQIKTLIYYFSFEIIDSLYRHRQTADEHSTFSWTSTLQKHQIIQKIDCLTEDLVLNDQNTKT